MSSRTDRIFAAFQGPVLSVGTPVVHMFRPYTVELLLPRHWREAHKISPEDVITALQRPEIRASASLSYPALTCTLCGDVVSMTDVRSSTDGLPDDLECYSAILRSTCTSSRRHLRCDTVVMAIALGSLSAFSEPFAVFAREPGRQSKRKQRQQRLSWPYQKSEFSSCVNMAISTTAPPEPEVAPTEDAAMGTDVCAKYVKNIIPNAIDRNRFKKVR
eukprot:m51a1_g7021 hypothetical protein (217) ;mRNA; f:42866-43875